MPRTKEPPPSPETNPVPRRDQKLNIRQELFAFEYLVDLDPGAAYKRAGYEVTNDEAAAAGGRRLLRDARVMSILDTYRLERIDSARNNAEKTIARLELIYLCAFEAADYANCISALRELGKHYGIYELDHRQKSFTAEDAERLRTRLVEMGMNFTRTNAPAHLQRVEPINGFKELPGTNGSGT